VSEVKLLSPKADVEPQKDGGRLQSEANQGDPKIQRTGSYMYTPHIFPVEPNFRITEDGILRVTENGLFLRILETA
jgi:hypothetical protein